MNEERVMLISGTSRGLGKNLVEHYVRKGFQVIGCSRGDAAYSFPNYRHFCLDVTDEQKVQRMFFEINKSYQRLDVLINNAGTTGMNYVMLTPLQVAEDIVRTNFLGPFLLSREAVKLMQRRRGGRIVNVSSIAVALSHAGTSVYSASKAAVEQFSRVLAREVAAYGITVNTLALSFVKDSGMAEVISEKAIQAALEATILKTWLGTDDVAHAVDFFIAPQSHQVTAQTLWLGGI